MKNKFHHKKILLLALALMLFFSCKREQEVYYGVNEEGIYPPSAGKDKLKSEEQYLSILYANLFQTALPVNDLVELTDLIESVGDKDVIHEIIISNFMNEPTVILPTVAEMNADVEAFVIEVYKRFFVRNPTEAEKTYFVNYINAHPTVTPELIYFAFALSNEYYFY